MNIAVCVKQVPDPTAPQKLDGQTFSLMRDGKLVMDESDSYGVEIALRLVEESGGGLVSLVSMGPRGEVAGLRSALAMGADRAVLVSDERLRGSDALSTAKVLAKAIELNPYDLVVAATESTDGYTGTMPVQLAEILGVPSVSFAKKVERRDGSIFIERQSESGYDEVECSLPLVITVTAGVVEPRYPSFKGIMAAKSKPVEILDLDDLGMSAQEVGGANARQRVLSVAPAESKTAGDVITDDGEAYLEIVEFLEKLKII